MKNRFLLGTACLSLALGAASCTNETEQLTDSRTAPMSIQVSNHIASRGLITLPTLPVDASGIGVTLVNKSDKQKYDGQEGYSNMQWTTTNGSSWNIASGTNPNLTGTEGVAVAYYPYSSSATDYTAIPVESASQTDYMYSGWSNDLNNATPQAEFTMNHALAAVRVKLAVSANYTGDKSASAVTIASDGFMASATLNAETGALTAKTGAGAEHTLEDLDLTLDATGQNVDFMVIPADAPEEITFLATIGEKQYSATVTPGEALAQGLIHTYTLTLSAEGMKVSTVEVTPWGEGQTGSNELKPAPVKIKSAGKANGVYAITSAGELIDYTTSEANSSLCIGVAFISDKQRIMIEKQDAYDGTNITYYWGYNLDNRDIVDIIDCSYDDIAAKADFNGKANTAAIIAAYKTFNVEMKDRDMCYVLNTFNASSNYRDWYIPAAGQLYEIYTNKTVIEEALSAIGGTGFGTRTYLASSECAKDKGWRVHFYTDKVEYAYKNGANGHHSCIRFIRDID